MLWTRTFRSRSAPNGAGVVDERVKASPSVFCSCDKSLTILIFCDIRLHHARFNAEFFAGRTRRLRAV